MREAYSYINTYNNTATDADSNRDLNCDATADALAVAVRAISYTLTYTYFNMAEKIGDNNDQLDSASIARCPDVPVPEEA